MKNLDASYGPRQGPTQRKIQFASNESKLVLKNLDLGPLSKVGLSPKMLDLNSKSLIWSEHAIFVIFIYFILFSLGFLPWSNVGDGSPKAVAMLPRH